jgi:hypothetical protein
VPLLVPAGASTRDDDSLGQAEGLLKTCLDVRPARCPRDDLDPHEAELSASDSKRLTCQRVSSSSSAIWPWVRSKP